MNLLLENGHELASLGVRAICEERESFIMRRV